MKMSEMKNSKFKIIYLTASYARQNIEIIKRCLIIFFLLFLSIYFSVLIIKTNIHNVIFGINLSLFFCTPYCMFVSLLFSSKWRKSIIYISLFTIFITYFCIFLYSFKYTCDFIFLISFIQSWVALILALFIIKFYPSNYS